MPRTVGRQRERGILRLSVEAAERVHLQGYVVYCVVAVCADGVRRRWRRYSQFLQLKEGLASADARLIAGTAEFPKKKWRQTLSFGAIERRRVRLHAFVSSLLENPLDFKSRVALRSFLALEPPVAPPAPPPSPPSALAEVVTAMKKAFGRGVGGQQSHLQQMQQQQQQQQQHPQQQQQLLLEPNGAAASRAGGQRSFGSFGHDGARAHRSSSRPASCAGSPDDRLRGSAAWEQQPGRQRRRPPSGRPASCVGGSTARGHSRPAAPLSPRPRTTGRAAWR